MIKRLLTWLNIYEEEIGLVFWTMALLFIIRSAGIILNNYAETAFLKRYGVEHMPVVNMVNAIATIFITGLLTGILNRRSNAGVLAYVFMICGALITGIRLLIPSGIELLYPLLFMLKSQFELIQAMLYWNICNDLFNTRQSKRLFPLLTAGGVVGLISGSVLTPFFAKQFNLDNLLYLYLATCLAGTATVMAMGRNYPRMIYQKPVQKTGKNKTTLFEEIKAVTPLIKKSTLVKVVLVLTFMPNVVIPIMNYQFNFAIDNQFASEAAVLKFFGYFRGSLYTVSLFILLFVGRIYGRWGLPVALMFHPFNYVIAFMAFLFRFDIVSAIYSRMSTNILRTTINMPTNGVLIGLFPERYRNLIRPFLRGTVVRVALFTGSTLILISSSLFHPRYLSLVALPFVLAWMVAPIILRIKYSTILKDLISNNLLDIKRFSQKELSQIFRQDKVVSDVESAFLSARGTDAVWYAHLLKNLSPGTLDERILESLPHQDEPTQVALIKMLSHDFRTSAAPRLIKHLAPQRQQAAVAIFKLAWQQQMQPPKDFDFSAYVNSNNPVIRGFATAFKFSGDPEGCHLHIKKWLDSGNTDQRRSGIVCAGLSRNIIYADRLLAILLEKPADIQTLVPDIIIAMSRLNVPRLNEVALNYLSHEDENIRLAALDALNINNDLTLKKAILMLGDVQEQISTLAREKINKAEYKNEKLLVQSLGLPGSKIRNGLFDLLEHLEVSKLDYMIFGRSQIAKCYACLAMAQNFSQLAPTPANNLAQTHLLEKKERILENTMRVLAIHDKTGQMKTAWQGFFSSDTRQRANAVELLNAMLDRKSFNAVLPLFESPSTQAALEQGKKIIQIPALDPGGRTGVTTLLTSPDWVDVVIGLNMIRQSPGIVDIRTLEAEIRQNSAPVIEKELDMLLNARPEQNSVTDSNKDISLGEKILLLKEIDIFSGLSAEELAAIAAQTSEQNYGEKETVIRQGETGETVFLIIEGKVEVIKELENGRQIFLDHIDAGQAFGEMALIDDAPRSATIRTVFPCRFLILHKQEFKETALEFPRISLQICSVLSRRIRDLHKKLNKI
ncbi:Npt1/Npt2 family nucleotide transporter [uncultured Desulfobacter sp.]|uniref:Npt1/Npt2 family nucleotide transporter n=1 Tax=uncultured Desulfobacter sp. TaxID=240139 RepID=UPI002AAA972F|nr:Npt1/Npt2 family nucleotide transporter [uncultured Desulfobacter sp.]